MSLPSPGMRPRAGGAPAAAPLIVTDGQPGDRVRSRLPAGAGAETPEGRIMRCDSDSGKKLIKSMVLRTADRQGMC